MQFPPIPFVRINGQSHIEKVPFFKLNLSKPTTLRHLIFNFVQVDGCQLQTFMTTGALSDGVSLLVSTALHFGIEEGSGNMWQVLKPARFGSTLVL